ncbi:putative GDSL-like Lipase/Acylhydrolase family protein [Hibiscus syriacus]|uniref:GDSL-like Lipase/Acylhydrolase family protein n=1 Tax=Hibiscus syriacus TaxID=106335 RepID=A0A6A3B6X7_HIBSY|nr:putative GDSL-like Lipase/Acylhydrolase family protein [Hibiscus syriacus]
MHTSRTRRNPRMSHHRSSDDSPKGTLMTSLVFFGHREWWPVVVVNGGTRRPANDRSSSAQAVFRPVLQPCRISTLFSSLAIPLSILIFGDSTVDTGNNNFIDTVFKANHLPCGQDFPGHIPSKLIPDFVADVLGIKQTVPPSLDLNLSKDDLQTGVSFASAGSGYDQITTVVTGAIPLPKQLEQFKSYIANLSRNFGKNEAQNIIEKSLTIISTGTNDFGFNYYLLLMRKQHRTSSNGTCSGPKRCLEDENANARSYNKKLVNLLPPLQATLPGAKIVYADIYIPLLDMMTNPEKYGFTESNKGCCETGLVEAAFLCNAETPVCENPSEFMFWDSIHPSETAYKALSDWLVNRILQKLTLK